MKKILLITLLFIVTANITQAQTFKRDVSKKGTSAAPFLSIGQGAKAAGMGSAFVGVADDASAIYWNPAGLADLDGANLIFDHTEWFADIKYNFVAASYKLGDFGSIGFGFTSSDYGEMKETTIDYPEGTGQTFTARDVVFSLAYAMKLNDRFSIGFNPKIIYQSIWRMSASSMAFDMGVKYITPFDDAILAMSITNFGGKMQLLGTSNLVLYDENPSSTGNNGKIPAYIETGEWALPLTFRVGVVYQPLRTELNKITIAVDALHPSDNYESLNVGAEYIYDNLVSLRAGYKSLFLTDSEEGLTLGIGLRQSLVGSVALLVDYAYQDFGRLSNIQKISFGINF